MQFDNSKYKKIGKYEEGKDVLDDVSLAKAADYKKNVLKNFTSIFQTDIQSRFRGNEYFVSRKYDGEYAIIFHSHGQTVTVNRSGRTRRGIPCIEEAGRLIEAAGIKEGIFPAEIYVEAGYKTRVNDLISALGSKGDISTLRLAVFDILEITGQPFRRGYYPDIHKRLNEVFGDGQLCHPADMITANSAEEIERIWRLWVDEQQSEGLIVHSRLPMSFKVKPRHFFDAVVVAYGEGFGIEIGQVRRMLFAFMPAPGKYQLMSRVGSGLNESLRKKLFMCFQDKTVSNPVKGMNPKWNDLVFVRPELVIEVAVEEVVTELASGEKTNTLLSFDGNEYRYEGIVSGYRTYTPVFIRLREDKSPDEHDAGTVQIDRFLTGMKTSNEAPRNIILYRDVLIKGNSVQTYCIWQTEEGYVLLDSLSSNNQTQREIFHSNDFYDLFNNYQRSVSSLMNDGFLRDRDNIIMTDRCIEVMNMEYEGEY